MVENRDFTEETLKQIEYLTKNKQTAFDILTENYKNNGEMDISATDIVSRLQVEYFALDRDENNLKTKVQWAQNEFYEPAQVNTAIPQITKGKYSSFALRTVGDTFQLSLPIDDDYASFVPPFSPEKDIPDIILATNLQVLKSKYGVKMGAENKYETASYKTDTIAGTLKKINNLFLSLSNKPISQYGKYNGTISLRSNIQGYKVTNVEKLICVYDLLFQKAIKSAIKSYKEQHNEKITKQVAFGARLFADILLARVLELQDVNNNKVLEKCLWLQFANALNKYGYSAKELKQITEIGATLTANTCKDLGITKDKIIERMKKLGFQHTCIPADEFQALIFIKQKDYTIYNDISATTTHISADSHVSEQPQDSTQSDGQDKAKGQDASQTDSSTGAFGINFDKTKIKPSTVKNMIDKAIIASITDQVSAYNKKIAKESDNSKTLKSITTKRDILVHILQYYSKTEKATTYKTSDTQEVRIAKAVAKHLIEEREKVVEYVSGGSVKKPENQRAEAFINQLFKQGKGLAVKKYYAKVIAECVEKGATIIEQELKVTIKDVEYYMLEVITKESCLQLGVNYLLLPPASTEDIVEEQDTATNSAPTGYVPNFVILDNDSRNK